MSDYRAEEIALFGDSNAETDSDASTLPLNGITTADHMTTQQLRRRYFPNSNATSPMPPLLPGDFQSEPTSNNQALVVLPLMSQRQMLRRGLMHDMMHDESVRAEAMARERIEHLVLDIVHSPVPSAASPMQPLLPGDSQSEPVGPNPAGAVETPATRPATEDFLETAEMAHEDWLRGGVFQQRPLEDETSHELSRSMILLHYSQSRSRRYRDAASVMEQDDPDSVWLHQRADVEHQLAERVEQVRRRARDRSFAVAEAYLQSQGNPCPCLIYHHTKPPSVISTILEVTSTIIHNPLHLSPSNLRQLQWYSSMVDSIVSTYAYGVGQWIVLIHPSPSKSDLPDPSRPD
jgi:hypothetical protein